MARTVSLKFTYDERRASALRLKGYSLADIAWDLKLDGCLKSKWHAQREARAILERAAGKLDGG